MHRTRQLSSLLEYKRIGHRLAPPARKRAAVLGMLIFMGLLLGREGGSDKLADPDANKTEIALPAATISEANSRSSLRAYFLKTTEDDLSAHKSLSPELVKEIAEVLQAHGDELSANSLAGSSSRVLENIEIELYLRNPHSAAAFIKSLTHNEEQNALYADLVYCWAKDDAAAVLSWAANIEEAPLREKMVDWAVEACALSDPKGVFTLITSTMLSEREREEITMDVVSYFVENQPSVAAKIGEEITEPGVRSMAIERIFSQWTQKDPFSAYVWIKGLPEADVLIAQLNG